MIYNIIAVLVSILIPMFILIKPIKEKQSISECKFAVISYIALVIGFMLRLVSIQTLPNALNVDEASSGYEAYSILHYGIDRTGHTLPVFLEAWGSGQNALLTYLIIPFVGMFGLSVLTTRLPMAIVGCISLIVMYYLLKNIFQNKKIATLGLVFFAICPWHIMKSRWGLESNLFPDMILLSTLLLILGLKNKKDYLLYIAFVVIGLTSYAYGTSYFFLPIYVSITLIYLFVKKELTWQKALISLCIAFTIAIPIVVFIIINTFDLPEISIFGFSVPRLVLNRYEQVSSIFSGGFIQNCINNFIASIKILIIQYDKLPWNQIKGIGLTYLISLPFTVYGIYCAIKRYKGNIFNALMNIWGITAFLLLFVLEPNVNRINIIIIPIIYYTIIGIYEFITQFPKIKYIVFTVYIIYFVVFIGRYATTDFNEYLTFNSDLKEVVEYAENSDCDTVYVAYTFKEPYIYYLFYSQYNTKEYVDTVEFWREYGTFENVKSFGKYKFYIPEEIEKNSLIIVQKEIQDVFDGEKIEFPRFNVYEVK